MMVNHLILGNGEVGGAICGLLTGDYGNAKNSLTTTYDKGEWEKMAPLPPNKRPDFLHICFPYFDDFVRTARWALGIFCPETLVIHSTLKPGTSEAVGYPKSIYSPFLGRHGDVMAKSTLKYPKPCAGSQEAHKDFDSCYMGETSYWGENTEELEFAKISSTNYMYWNLIYQKMVAKYCEQNGYNFEKVYREWNLNYNLGIKEDHSDWQRPVYDLDPEPIPGGHCLNANIFLSDDPVSNLLRTYQQMNTKTKKGK